MIYRRLVAVLIALFLISISYAQEGVTTVKWHGHAAFEIITPSGIVLFIDPWLNNPANPNAKDWMDPIATIEHADYILITHGHFDHIGDAVALAKKTGARLVTNSALASNLAKIGGYPRKQMGLDTLMNIGGEIKIANGEIKVIMTPAVHSSGMPNPKAGANEPDVVYGGNPAGFIIKIKNGPVIYHSGDTAYFSDMRLIGLYHRPDLALINIGGHFGMEPRQAADAAMAVRARLITPHHYGTYPILTKDPRQFIRYLRRKGLRAVIMQPGSSMQFKGRRLIRLPTMPTGQ